MYSILFLTVLLISCSVSFTQSQEPHEPYVDDDDTLDAAALIPKGQKKEPEPKYPDGVNTIPGDAETDYPTYNSIWKTGFSCSKLQPGFYADVEARCQIWHTCDTRGHQQSFLCSNGTIFSQTNRVCEWWYNVNCELKEVEANYQVNDDLYQIPESASHWQEDNERRENEAKSLEDKFPPKPQPQKNFNNRQKEQEQEQHREPATSKPQQNYNRRDEDDGQYRPPAKQQQQQYREPSKPQQQQQQHREPPKPQTNFNYKDNTRQNEVAKPKQVGPVVPLSHVIGRDEIRAILSNQTPDDNSGLSEDERFPLKAKLRMQREREAQRLKDLEAAKQKQAKDNEPQPLPVRVVKLEQNQQQNKPAIIRLSNNFGVNPPKSTPQSFRQQPQQQYSTTQAPVYRPTTTTTYVPRTYATQRTPAPAPVWATTTTTTTRRPPQNNYVRPTAPPPPPPPPATPSDYNRPRPQDNYVRPTPRDEQERNKFENTDESKFPQQPQARSFPSFNSASKPIRIEDPVNSGIQDDRANRYQQQQERRFQNSDVNADGNRFQNGETRRGSGANQQQRGQQQPQQQDRRPAQNRYQNEEEPTTERPRQPNVDRGQPASRPQQQQQPQRRQHEENLRPQQQQQQQEQRRPRPKNDEAPAPSTRRPYQEEERPAPTPSPRRTTPEPEPRNAVRESQGKPDSAAPVFSGPQFAAPESYRQRFRHSTPRHHNVQFAPSSRSNSRDSNAEESQVSEESQQHPVPSVYNHRFVHQQQPQQRRQEVPKSRPEPVVEEKIYTWQTTKRPETVRSTEPVPVPVRAYSQRPTPRPETVLPVLEGGIKNSTIVRIIVKQRPNDQNERQPERRRSEAEDESLDVREEEDFIHREAERGFGGRYTS